MLCFLLLFCILCLSAEELLHLCIFSFDSASVELQFQLEQFMCTTSIYFNLSMSFNLSRKESVWDRVGRRARNWREIQIQEGVKCSFMVNLLYIFTHLHFFTLHCYWFLWLDSFISDLNSSQSKSPVALLSKYIMINIHQGVIALSKPIQEIIFYV